MLEVAEIRFTLQSLELRLVFVFGDSSNSSIQCLTIDEISIYRI